jgi:hypothetical protein
MTRPAGMARASYAYSWTTRTPSTRRRWTPEQRTRVTRVTPLFLGDRLGRVRDPLRNIWWTQTHTEDVDPSEMQRRAGDNVEAMAYVQRSLEEAMAHRATSKAR